MKIPTFLGLIATMTAGALSASPRVQEPLAINEVLELRGYVGERWQANREGSLHRFDIDAYVRLVEERKHTAWWWAGEQDGKWLESAVLSSSRSDQKLRAKAQEVLDRIMASQEADGYVGITAKEIRSTGKPLRGMDPYELYFKLHAFITAYEQWKDDKALTAAKKLADYLVANIGPGKAEFWPSKLRAPENRQQVLKGQSDIAGHSVHYSWEGTLLIDPMLRLAQLTGDTKYKDWSQWVVNSIDRWSGWDSFSALDKVAEGQRGINEVQPYVHAHTFQMNFLGFLRLYELTGDASLLNKVAGVWEDVAARQMYITGGVSVGEHYEAGHIKPVTGQVVETCATMSWLQLTQYLLELTGKAGYADAMERLLWNHVFASQAIDGDSYRYHTPPNGEKPSGYFHGTDCCTSSGHRMVSLLPTFLYGKSAKGIYINQYVSSTVEVQLADGARMRLRQETNFPESTFSTLLVEEAPSSPVAVHLRLPSWCKAPSVSVNGTAQNKLLPGEYLPLERAWKAGDLIRIDLPMELAWVQSDAPWRTITTHLPGGEPIHRPIEGDTPPWALTRGPVVYAVDTLWWNNPKVKAPVHAGGLGVLPELSELKEMPKPAGIVGPAYEGSFVTREGQPVRALLVPFTNIGRWYRENENRPKKNAPAYSYAIWMQSAKSATFKSSLLSTTSNRQRFEHSVDYVVIGDEESELAHALKGGSTETFEGKSYRKGSDLSANLKLPLGRDGTLVVSYSAAESVCEFDVLANKQVLRTERIAAGKFGEIFEARYKIPGDLIKNMTDDFGQPVEHITLRIKSRSKQNVCPVLGLRIE